VLDGALMNLYAPLNDPIIFDLKLRCVNIKNPLLAESPIIFHGVNKSGSLAFAKVLHDAYSRSGNLNRFMCRYMQLPAGRSEALDEFKDKLPIYPILIDHGLVGFEDNFNNAKLVTLLRDPVERMVSIYFWLKSNHSEKIMGRDLVTWVRHESRVYSQVRQFAFDHRDARTAHNLDRMSVGEMISIAEHRFMDKVEWYGVCEKFEESVIMFLALIGFTKVPVWEVDVRNTHKPKAEALPRKLHQEISDIIGYDIAFYESKKVAFEKSLEQLDLNQEILQYKKLVNEVTTEVTGG